MVVLNDEEEVIDLTGAADGSLLAELLSAYDAANAQVAVKEEKGDALIFNGSPAHGVVHGLTNPVRRIATYRGKSQPLVGMRIVDDKRMSVQARMS